MANGVVGLAIGASALGLVHGLAPGHGWAIAASYALDKPNKWFYGAASSLILGVGHLISSIAMVLLYFFALSYFDLTQIGWMNYVAGAMLIGLGIWQYFNGHEHTAGEHDSDPGEEHADHDHGHSHDHDQAHTDTETPSRFARLRGALPFVGDSDHSHSHGPSGEETDRGLYGMAALAFALGFAHNEEFDIIAICTGSSYCLELMLLYAVSVIVSLVGITLLLVAGYERYEERLEDYTQYLPTVTAAILVVMGVGFIAGVF
jgi:ABC-type nickel/cobalt efflux system permease component RcnA